MSKLRITDRGLTLAAAVSMTLWAAQASAQESSPNNVQEEVVVTGSYIKQGKFDAPSPVEVITNDDILQAGEPNLGEYVRDLTFTTNTDTVANVLAGQDGGQDSTTARFNIRGLGVGSTLTLFDGRRTIEQGAIGSLVPELGLQRVEVVLDGGAALYGTDAVAGVVNLIPIKKFDGMKARVFYTQDQDADFHQPKYSVLFGKSFDRLNAVAAFDYSKRTALRRSDRPRFLNADDDDSNAGNPGAFLTPTGATIRDPGCGSFNTGNTDDGQIGSFPSGVPVGTTVCGLQFGEFQDYARASEEMSGYGNLVWELNDKVNIEFQVNAGVRTSELLSSPSTANAANNLLLVIPVANPGNPTRGTAMPVDVRASPTGFRPFGKSGTLPSFLDDQGALHTDFTTFTDRYKLGATYDFGDSSWSGETWASIQTSRLDVDAHFLRLDRLQAALRGMGGPNGNEFFNPTASADPRSPLFVASGPNKTANSQALVDSLYQRDRFEANRSRLTYFESIVTGDLFKLPAGTLALAGGVQVRENVSIDHPNPAEAIGQDYDTSVRTIRGAPIPNDITRRFESQVNAAFVELQIPIFEKLTLQAAARYEDFRDLDLNTTTPKFALRYEPFSNLSLRASYGEGFLAPRVEQVQAFTGRNCAEVFTGSDPFNGVSLNGTRSCESGNPGLGPEESETINVGFSWRPITGMEVSLDYQMIDYTDRIQTLTSQDLVNRDFARFLTSMNLSAAQFNAMTVTQRAALSNAWFASNPDPLITRATTINPATGVPNVTDVTRIPANISGNEVDVFDLRFRYGFDAGNIGYFSTSLSTTYYDKYEYTDFNGKQVSALGKRNADTALAPPLPEFKHSLLLGWARKNQSAGVTVKYADSVSFDGTVDAFNGIPAPKNISSFLTVDARYSIELDKLFGGKWDLAFGSNNVFNEQADALPVSGGLESRLQDPFGRTFYLEANYSFE